MRRTYTPRTSREDDRNKADKRIPHARPWSVSVLVVGDFEIEGMCLSLHLRQLGYGVTHVQTIADALRFLSASDYDVCFLDTKTYLLINAEPMPIFSSNRADICKIVVISGSRPKLDVPVLLTPIRANEAVCLIDTVIYTSECIKPNSSL